MQQTEFENIIQDRHKRNMICYVARDNDWLKIGAVFTIRGIDQKIKNIGGKFDNSNRKSISELLEMMHKVRIDVINSIELGNPESRMVLTGNDMGAYN